MSTTTFEANEHSALHAALKGVAADYSGAQLVLAGGPAYSDEPTETWATVGGVALGEGEVADYTLPIPFLSPGHYELEIYAQGGGKRIDIAPAAGKRFLLQLGDRRHDNASPERQEIVVQGGSVEVREADRPEQIQTHVVDDGGARLASGATYQMGTSAVRVVQQGGTDLPTDELGRVRSVPTDLAGEVPLRAQLDGLSEALGQIPTEKAPSLYAQAQAAGYDGTEADFYALLVAQAAGNGRQATPWKRITSYPASGVAHANDGDFAVFEDFEQSWSDVELELRMTVQRNTSVEVRARARIAGGLTAEDLTSHDQTTLSLPEKRILEDQATCVWRVRPTALGLSPRGLFVRYETYGTSAAADYDVTDARCCLHYTPLST